MKRTSDMEVDVKRMRSGRVISTATVSQPLKSQQLTTCCGLTISDRFTLSSCTHL